MAGSGTLPVPDDENPRVTMDSGDFGRVSTRRFALVSRWRMRTLAMASGVLLAVVVTHGHAQPPGPKPRALPTQLGGEWKGDFDGMLERRMIRVLVPYSRTLYFNDKGRERGVTADFVRDFERYVNEKYRK